jgi:hypothetical protein
MQMGSGIHAVCQGKVARWNPETAISQRTSHDGLQCHAARWPELPVGTLKRRNELW